MLFSYFNFLRGDVVIVIQGNVLISGKYIYTEVFKVSSAFCLLLDSLTKEKCVCVEREWWS